jgi:hypothetical protein
MGRVPHEPTGSGHERGNLARRIRHAGSDEAHQDIRQESARGPGRCDDGAGAEKKTSALKFFFI